MSSTAGATDRRFANGTEELAYISRGAAQRNVDPYAVLAVATHEGVTLPGQVGDQGTSFGPWQLHAGGALPAAVWSRGPSYADQWANSPAGVDYALDRIAQVAAGLRGNQAVSAIVTRFERPANPPAEVTSSEATYAQRGIPSTGGSSSSGGGLVGAWTTGVGDIGSAAGSAAQHIPGVVQAEAVGNFLGKLTDPAYILRGLQIVAGAGLVAAGVILLARQVALATDLPDPVAMIGASKVGPGGAGLRP